MPWSSSKLVRSSNVARTSFDVTLKPMAHQAMSLAHDEKNPVVYDASDAGTGKTAVRILGFAKRRKKGGGKALVLAPKSLLRSAWLNDFKKFAPHLKVVVSEAGKHDKVFAQDADAYITNYDAVKWLAKQKPHFFADFDELVIDEPTAFKHHTSQRSRAIAKIRKYFKQRKGMSATPNSNGICDIWHQIYILDDGKRLGQQFFGFRASVCTPKQVGPRREMVQWIDKEGAEEAVFGLLSDIVIRHKLDDCVDIPQTHFHEVEYELPAKQRKAYDQMELTQLLLLMPQAEQVAEALEGRRTAAVGSTNTKQLTTLTAINAAAVATKLLQIASGAVYGNDGQYHIIDEGRYELILDLIEAREHSLVFFQWRHQKEMLVKLAEARKVPYCVIDGDTPPELRAQYVESYQRGCYQVAFAHPKSAAHGLTLTRGTSTIWSGPTYDLELYEQGNKRQRRIGQTKKTEVITVLATETIEEKVYDMLRGKDARMKNLLDLFASMSSNVDRRKIA